MHFCVVDVVRVPAVWSRLSRRVLCNVDGRLSIACRAGSVKVRWQVVTSVGFFGYHHFSFGREFPGFDFAVYSVGRGADSLACWTYSRLGLAEERCGE